MRNETKPQIAMHVGRYTDGFPKWLRNMFLGGFRTTWPLATGGGTYEGTCIEMYPMYSTDNTVANWLPSRCKSSSKPRSRAALKWFVRMG